MEKWRIKKLENVRSWKSNKHLKIVYGHFLRLPFREWLFFGCLGTSTETKDVQRKRCEDQFFFSPLASCWLGRKIFAASCIKNHLHCKSNLVDDGISSCPKRGTRQDNICETFFSNFLRVYFIYCKTSKIFYLETFSHFNSFFLCWEFYSSSSYQHEYF